MAIKQRFARKTLHYGRIFLGKWYFFLILFADDPFSLLERYSTLNYKPPPRLFWILLIVSATLASFFAWLEIRSNKKVNKSVLAKKNQMVLDITNTLTNISTYYNSLVPEKSTARIEKKQFVKAMKQTLADTGIIVYPYDGSKALQQILRNQVRKNIKNLGLSNADAKDFNEEDIRFMNTMFFVTSNEPFGLNASIINDSEERKRIYNKLMKRSDSQMLNLSSILSKLIYKYRDAALGMNNIYVLYRNCPPSLKRKFFIAKRFYYKEFTDCRDRYLTELLRMIKEKAEVEFGIRNN